MTRGPGPVQRQVLAWLQEAVEKESRAEWIAVVDLTQARLGQDDPPSRDALDATRKAIARLADQGQVEVSQQSRLITRVVISPVAGNGAPKQIQEQREVTVVRLTPSIEQQHEEALAEVAKAQAAVLAHPGWGFAESELVKAKREAQRLRAQVGVVDHARR